MSTLAKNPTGRPTVQLSKLSFEMSKLTGAARESSVVDASLRY